MDLLVDRVHQTNAFPSTVEIARKLTGHRNARTVTSVEGRRVPHHQRARAGRQTGDSTAGEGEINAALKANSIEVQCDAARDVLHLDILIFLSLDRVGASSHWSRIIHDLRHAKMLLQIARKVGRGEAVHLTTNRVRDENGLTAGRKLALVAADHEQALTTTWSGRASLEPIQIARDVDDAIIRNDRSGLEREVHPATNLPTGDIKREGRGIRHADEFLQLIAPGRIHLSRKDANDGIGRLRQRNARVVRPKEANGFGAVGDAVSFVEMNAAQVDELVEEFVDRVGERFVGRRPRRIAPRRTVKERLSPNHVRHVPDVAFQQA